jgi:hypothetical protein
LSELTGSLTGAHRPDPPAHSPVAAEPLAVAALADPPAVADDPVTGPATPAAPASPPAPEWSGEPDPFPLPALAAVVGEYRWIENALYAVLGEWVNDMPVAAVQVHLDGESQRHAWHADLWADRLPVLAGSDPAAFTVPSPATVALFATLQGAAVDLDGSTTGYPEPEGGSALPRPGALPRLAGLYRVVLPRLATTYERHLRAVTHSPTDPPVRRALRLVLNDTIEDWHTGERLVQRLVTRPHDVAAVHDFLRHLESAVVAAGARSGLVTLGESVPEN